MSDVLRSRNNHHHNQPFRYPCKEKDIETDVVDNDGMDRNQRLALFPCNRPATPSMSTFHSRLSTYSTWNIHNTISPPEALAYAGFYSRGIRDKLQCFYCGGGLQNWDRDDDPWVEHAKWYPNCEYLLQKKGPEFVSDITSRFPDIDRASVAPPVPLDIPPTPEPPPLPSVPARPRTPVSPASPVLPNIHQSYYQPEDISMQTSNSFSFGPNFPFGNIEMNTGESSISINNGQIRIIGGRGVTVTRNGGQTTISRQGNNTNVSSNTAEVRQDLLTMGYSENEINTVLQRLRSRNVVPDVHAALDELRITSGEPERYVSQEEGNISGASNDPGPCVVCLENAKEMLMVPCGHFCSCRTCSRRLERCPICRANVEKIVRVFT